MNKVKIIQMALGISFFVSAQNAWSNAGHQKIYKREIIECDLLYSKKNADPVLQIGNLFFNLDYYIGTETESINNLGKYTVYGSVATTLPYPVEDSESGEFYDSNSRFKAGRINAVNWFKDEDSAVKMALAHVTQYSDMVKDLLLVNDFSPVNAEIKYKYFFPLELSYLKINTIDKNKIEGELFQHLRQGGTVPYSLTGACRTKIILK